MNQETKEFFKYVSHRPSMVPKEKIVILTEQVKAIGKGEINSK